MADTIKPKEISGDVFYEDFKNSLRAIGLRFGEMHLARVTVKDSTVTVRHRNTSVTLHFGSDDESTA